MGAYIVLAEKTVAAEFPDFAQTDALAVFALLGNAQRHRREHARDTLLHGERLQSLAKLCGVDELDLRMQFESFEPLAEKFYKEGTVKSIDAWAQALLRIGAARKETRANHPLDAIKPAVLRGLHDSASTSGVEHSFACYNRMGIERRHLSEEMENDILKIVLDRRNCDEDAIVSSAISMWQELFAAPRPCRGKVRVLRHDRPSGGTPTEAGWLHKRRRSVQIAVDDLGEDDEVEAGKPGRWLRGHDQEPREG